MRWSRRWRARHEGPGRGAPPAPTHHHPTSPPPRLWNLAGYGKLRATTHPPPRTFPHPLEIPAHHPPTSGIPTATHSRGDEVTYRQEGKQKHDRLHSHHQWPRRPLRSTMSPARRYAPTGWPASIGMGGRLHRNPQTAPERTRSRLLESVQAPQPGQPHRQEATHHHRCGDARSPPTVTNPVDPARERQHFLGVGQQAAKDGQTFLCWSFCQCNSESSSSSWRNRW
jgi:hypothetical protein